MTSLMAEYHAMTAAYRELQVPKNEFYFLLPENHVTDAITNRFGMLNFRVAISAWQVAW